MYTTMTAIYKHIPSSWIKGYLEGNKAFEEHIRAKARDAIKAEPKLEGVVRVVKLKHRNEKHPKTYYVEASDLCSVFTILSEDTSSHDSSDHIRVVLEDNCSPGSSNSSDDDSDSDDADSPEPNTYFVSKYALVRDRGSSSTLWRAADTYRPSITLHLLDKLQVQTKELTGELGQLILNQAIRCDNLELFQYVTKVRGCIDDILLGITIYGSLNVLKYMVQTYPDRVQEQANPVLSDQYLPICMAAWKGHDEVAEIVFDFTDQSTILNAKKSLLVETMYGYGASEGMCLDRILNKLASNMDLVTALANREPCHAKTRLNEFAKMVEATRDRSLSVS